MIANHTLAAIAWTITCLIIFGLAGPEGFDLFGAIFGLWLFGLWLISIFRGNA